MGNMSYCRFENALEALRDCYNNLDDDLSNNKVEARARVKLVEVCQKIVDTADIDNYQLEKEISNDS